MLQDEEMFSAFKAAANNFEHDDGRGIFKKLISYVWKSSEKPTVLSVEERKRKIDKKMYLVIYGNSRNVVDDAKDKIKNFLNEQKITQKIESQMIVTLSKQQLDILHGICKKNDVSEKVDKNLNRIMLSGCADDVTKASGEISWYFQNIKGKEESEKEDWLIDFAKTTAQTVQWIYETLDGKVKEYDRKTNAIIENSYSKKEKSVIIIIHGFNHEIVFEDMEMKNLKNNKTVKVTRKYLKLEKGIPIYSANSQHIPRHSWIIDTNDSINMSTKCERNNFRGLATPLI